MEARAHLKYVRISPRKVQIVLDLIRGKDTDTAMAILKNTTRSLASTLSSFLRAQLQTLSTTSIWMLETSTFLNASYAPDLHSREYSLEHRAEHSRFLREPAT